VERAALLWSAPGGTWPRYATVCWFDRRTGMFFMREVGIVCFKKLVTAPSCKAVTYFL